MSRALSRWRRDVAHRRGGSRCRRPAESSLRVRLVSALTCVVLLAMSREAMAQLTAVQTADATVVYLEPTQSFIAPYTQRTVENSLAFHRKLFDYTPKERITVLLTDFSDAGQRVGRSGAAQLGHVAASLHSASPSKRSRRTSA